MMFSAWLQPAVLLALCTFHAVGMAVNQDRLEETECACGGEGVLRCSAQYKAGVQYRSVRWYKVGEPPAPRLSGLLLRNLPAGVTQRYVGVTRQVELLGDSRDIVLPNVTAADGGVYSCLLAAPVGEQNQEGQVHLTVTGCPDSQPQPVNQIKDAYLVILATIVLMVSLLIFRISYGSLKNLLKDKNKATKKETFLDAKMKPLEKKDLMLIYTLGPNWSTSTMKHACV